MPATTLRGAQVRDGTVQRADLDITTVGNAVIRKLVQGSGVTLSSTGADAGTGDVTINATGNFDPSVDAVFTASQSIILTNAALGTDDAVLNIRHRTSGTPAAGFGTTLWLLGDSATVADRDMAQLYAAWSDPTDATRKSYVGIRLAAGALIDRMRLHSSGGVSFGTVFATDPGAGYANVATGYKINNVACMPPSGGAAGQMLVKNSATNYDFGWDKFVSTQTALLTATAGTVSTVGVHAGYGGSARLTPAITGRVLLIFSGYLSSSVAGAFAAVIAVRYGTSTAPAHGAAATGTNVANVNQSYGHSAAALYAVPFTVCCVVSGLTVGTDYWFDWIYGSSSAGSTAKLNACAASIAEF